MKNDTAMSSDPSRPSPTHSGDVPSTSAAPSPTSRPAQTVAIPQTAPTPSAASSAFQIRTAISSTPKTVIAPAVSQ